MIQSETLELLEWPRLCQHLASFAATKLGVIAAAQLRIPETQSESLQLLAQTQEIYQLESTTPNGLPFKGIHDIGAALERAELQGLLAGTPLLEIATTLAGVRQLRRIIDSQPEVPVLTALVADLRTYPELEQEIHHCIDEQGRVADRASPKLTGIREQQKHRRDQIYQILQRILQRQAHAVQEQLITQRGDRFVIPVKAPQKDAIPGIVHDASTTGATLYIEPHKIVNLGNQLRQLQRQEQAEEEAILRRLSAQVAAVKSDLEHLLAVATLLDLATARARYSYWLGANPPRFISPDADETVTLRQLRHPLLVWQQMHEQGISVVPIDLLIQPHIRVVAITGPNTGGKTVTLKTLGLVTLMAKVGLFIPAREPVELPWFDQVLADIGDEQSLQQNLSTFSGHIQRISRILQAIEPEAANNVEMQHVASLQNFASGQMEGSDEVAAIAPIEETAATPSAKIPANALVLLDEVGAGTDPSEGSALAIALLKYLAEQTRLTVATTHFGELKALKYQDERFENASVEFDDVTLSPTYRLLWGIPGRSNALTIARRLGLHPAVVDQAQAQRQLGDTEDVNQVIAGLEAQRRSQESKAQASAQLLNQTERLHREVAQKAAALRERERQLKQEQEQAVQQAIAQAKTEIAQVIKQLQQGPVKAQDAKQATDALNQIQQQYVPPPPPPPPSGFRPQVGDRIRIPRLGQTAEVITAPDADGELSVRFGLMKMTVSLTDVESLTGEKAELPTRPKSMAHTSVASKPEAVLEIRTSQNTIDLRGNRVADAEVLVDRKIATLQGPLWIIHGHGTGKLRKGLQAFLQRHPQVEHYKPAEPEDGGTGVTVAYIRHREGGDRR
ncbi:MAG: endonuclease MutS2 [Cyanothece sp. SIO1E1]|nr:endonuclease MutS2 [Cyanothece sp. SIO1E1]